MLKFFNCLSVRNYEILGICWSTYEKFICEVTFFSMSVWNQNFHQNFIFRMFWKCAVTALQSDIWSDLATSYFDFILKAQNRVLQDTKLILYPSIRKSFILLCDAWKAPWSGHHMDACIACSEKTAWIELPIMKCGNQVFRNYFQTLPYKSIGVTTIHLFSETVRSWLVEIVWRVVRFVSWLELFSSWFQDSSVSVFSTSKIWNNISASKLFSWR